MNITFTPVSKGRKDLRVIITHRGKIYRKSIGISADTWNPKTQKSGHFPTDSAIKKIKLALESSLDELSSASDVKDALDHIYKGEWKEKRKYTRGKKEEVIPSFNEFFKDWSEKASGAKTQNRLTYNVVTKILGKDIDWEDIDSATYVRLTKKFNSQGFRPNYQGVLIGRLKTCLNEAYALHYIRNADFKDWKKPRESTFAIALTDAEIEAVESYQTDNAVLAKTRDMFLLGLYTAARFSDYSRLSLSDIQDGKIRFVQEKTEGAVVIPCSPKVKTILEKYDGHAPVVASQVFNRDIKRLCKLIGMDKPIQVPPTIRKKLKKKDGEPVYKYELVSSHTCRRTAISKLYREGVPTALICKVSGHKTEAQLMQYVKVTADEAALQLAELDFFK